MSTTLSRLLLPQIAVLKAANAQELVEIAQAEVALRVRLVGAHQKAATVALRRMLAQIESSSSKASLRSALAQADRAYTRKIRPLVRRLMSAHVPKTYDLAFAAAVKRANGEVGPLRYNIRAAQSVAKATDPDLDENDDDNKEQLLLIALLWVPSAFKDIWRPAIERRIQTEIIEAGLRGERALAVAEQIGQDVLGLPAAAPDAPKTALPYMAGVAAQVTTLTRAVATLQAFHRAGIVAYRWRAVIDRRTCPRCEALDGRIFPVKETLALQRKIMRAQSKTRLKTIAPWRSERDLLALIRQADATSDPQSVLLAHGVTFPVHPQCLPGNTLVSSRGRITACSKRWYEGELVVLQCAGQLPLSCTPNHPILTKRGWVAATNLDVGDEIACPGFGQGIRDRDGQNIQAPALVEDVASAFFKSRCVTSVKVPVSPPDFHGDGIGSKIAVVGTDRLLFDGLDASQKKLTSATVEMLSGPLFGDASNVHAHDLVFRKLDRRGHRKFSGLVYNLETELGYYVAAGYVNHNCRCSVDIVRG